MKLASFIFQNQAQVGIVDTVAETVQCFRLSPAEAHLGALVIIDAMAAGFELPTLGEILPLASVQLLAPIPRPRRNIFCVGKNYLDHVKEVAQSGLGSGSSATAAAVPEYPIYFSKVPECVIATHQPIESHPQLTQQLDYEAELALVIGRGGRAIRREDALQHVWGYSIINDVSARDLQKRHQQWHLAKSLDSFAPFGPWLVSQDEIPCAEFTLDCWVNGELRQSDSTRNLIFDIPTIIATLSAGITLYPGDIIATGTPSGVGVGLKPPRFLQRGDCVRIQISGIGCLENVVA